MKSLQYMLFTNWHLMRLIRLVLGIVISIQAFQMHDAVLGMLASFILFQVVTNTGCCGASGCDLPNN